MMLDLVLWFVGHTLTLVTTQCDTRIDLDYILAFLTLCPGVWLQKNFACPKLDVTQCKV